MKILVVRNDKLGDFMLAWPAFAMLKLSMPHAEVCALVPEYTKAIADNCPWIDQVIVDSTSAQTLQQHQFDATIALFSSARIARVLRKAKIPYRLAPATKIFQFLYTHRLTQRRSLSLQPEFEYNLDLVRSFLKDQKTTVTEPSPCYWNIDGAIRQQYRDEMQAKPAEKLIFLHSGSGGSANNLTAQQYTDFVYLIHQQATQPLRFILTAGPGEERAADALCQKIEARSVPAQRQLGKPNLLTFAQSISAADAMIAGSTGPLHIAGALDVPTVGFYPAKRSSTPLRWQTLNRPGRRIAFSPDVREGREDDMSLIDISAAAKETAAFLSQL